VRRASSGKGKNKNKGKYDSGLAELDTSFDDDNEQVVFSVGETKRTSSGNADSQFDNHYSQITPKSYQFKALFRKNFKLQVPPSTPSFVSRQFCFIRFIFVFLMYYNSY
jgi:hypothetical protein